MKTKAIREWVEDARTYEKEIRHATVKSLMNKKAVEKMRFLLRIALDHLEKRQPSLYVWRNVLYDYSAGVIFAIATSPDEARQAVIENAEEWRRGSLAAAMATEPECYPAPYGTFLHGGG